MVRPQTDNLPVIVIDSREKRPYEFPRCRLGALKTGDYSIAGCEDRVAVERKTVADAYASLGRGRGRFRREVERLGRLEYGAIVVEADLRGFLCPPAFSQMNPKAALGTLLAWSVRYGIGVLFAGDREHGNDITQKLLEAYWRYQGDGTGG